MPRSRGSGGFRGPPSPSKQHLLPPIAALPAGHDPWYSNHHIDCEFCTRYRQEWAENTQADVHLKAVLHSQDPEVDTYESPCNSRSPSPCARFDQHRNSIFSGLKNLLERSGPSSRNQSGSGNRVRFLFPWKRGPTDPTATPEPSDDYLSSARARGDINADHYEAILERREALRQARELERQKEADREELRLRRQLLAQERNQRFEQQQLEHQRVHQIRLEENLKQLREQGGHLESQPQLYRGFHFVYAQNVLHEQQREKRKRSHLQFQEGNPSSTFFTSSSLLNSTSATTSVTTTVTTEAATTTSTSTSTEPPSYPFTFSIPSMPGAWPTKNSDFIEIFDTTSSDQGSPTPVAMMAGVQPQPIPNWDNSSLAYGLQLVKTTASLAASGFAAVYNTAYTAYNFIRNHVDQNDQTPTTASPDNGDVSRASKRRKVDASSLSSVGQKVHGSRRSIRWTAMTPDTTDGSSSDPDAMDIDEPDIVSTHESDHDPIHREIGHANLASTSTSTSTSASTSTSNNRNRRSKAKNRHQLPTPAPEHYSASPSSNATGIHHFFDNERGNSVGGLKWERLAIANAKKLELHQQQYERNRREEAAREEASRKIEEERRLAEEARLEASRREREAREAALKEQQRLEEEQRVDALGGVGLHQPIRDWITPLSDEWNAKVDAARQTGKVKVSHGETIDMGPRDFGRLIPSRVWLNDDAVSACLLSIAAHVNNSARVKLKHTTPRCVVTNPFFWTNLRHHGPDPKQGRLLKRVWGVTPENFLNIETFIIPICQDQHWTLLFIRPKRREIAFVDSFQTQGTDRLELGIKFLAHFLGDKYKADEWNTISITSPPQTNGFDCGVFVVCNAILLAKGVDPYSTYRQADLDLQRRRLAAMLLNGGFKGDFDLAGL